MSVIHFAVGLLLTTWLILTVASHLPIVNVFVFRHIRFGRWGGLIPSWAFFAPQPARKDYTLLYRELYDSGDLSSWYEVSPSVHQRSILTALWNPESRPKKALSDAISYLIRLARKQGTEHQSLIISIPYLLLLNRISQIPHGPGVSRRQFLVVSYSRTAPEPEIVFLSYMHDV